MTPAVTALLASAESLSPAERRELADALLFDLEEGEGVPADFKLSPAWQEEIARRWADLESGRVKAVPMGEVMARVFGRRSADG